MAQSRISDSLNFIMVLMEYNSWILGYNSFYTVSTIIHEQIFENATRFIRSAKFEKSQIKRYEQVENSIPFYFWHRIKDSKKSISGNFDYLNNSRITPSIKYIEK